MLPLTVFALALSASAGHKSIPSGGEAYGPPRSLTCTWFTNFENSRLEQCQDGTGKLLRDGDGASIRCVRNVCEELHAAARKAADWKKPEPPWGTFTVELLGRVSLKPRKKRYLGDSTRTVLIEEVRSITVSQ